MNTEDLLPDGGEPVVVPEDGAEQVQEGPELVNAEDLASELGWSPKDKWRGDPEAWKPAGDFLKGTIAVNKANRGEIKSLRDTVGRIERTTSTLIERVQGEALAKLQAQFKEAEDVGDVATAVSIRDEIKKVEAQSPNQVPPEIDEFTKRHAQWFQVDPLATQMAINIAEMAARQGLTPAEQVARVEEQMPKRFPEYFDTPKPQAKPLAQVTEPMGRMARPPVGNNKKGYADLPAEAKKAADAFLAKGGVPVEQYAAEYWKENA